MNEDRSIEFKENVSNTFLKTVSAFANYGTGKILFGVKDDGTAVGVKNLAETRLDIENKINDAIRPRPEFSFSVNELSGVLELIVYKGEHTPYLYKGKAYKRADTADIEVEQEALRRLTLQGAHLYFEQLESKEQGLRFGCLGNLLQSVLQIENVTDEVLRSLGLKSKGQYNIAAEILSDSNDVPGISIVRFGDDISVIKERESLKGSSILEQFQQAVEIYRRNYCLEIIEGIKRIKKESIPEKAFREALANAIVHRDWSMNVDIQVAMHPEKIEIVSPGRLSDSLSEEEYMRGGISSPNNPVLDNVFFRLHIIELLGTGIRRIRDLYERYTIKPHFEVLNNSLRITLPLAESRKELTAAEKMVFDSMDYGRPLASSELADKVGVSKKVILGIMKSLESKKYVQMSGAGRSTRYTKL
ncbi:MAG: putative DNA binding domain-containing protein [Selenomonadaceae bacterium]|nr:putative DNA binding domain-containing protein [Selenomonadaceae bacterium]